MPDACFVTFRLRDAKKTIGNINPFCLQKALENTAGIVKKFLFAKDKIVVVL
jgi:hypothetical protein